MTIEEVSQHLHLTKDTLRYWEKAGLIGPVKRDAKGTVTIVLPMSIGLLISVRCGALV
mgnify:CR=1 FL=1